MRRSHAAAFAFVAAAAATLFACSAEIQLPPVEEPVSSAKPNASAAPEAPKRAAGPATVDDARAFLARVDGDLRQRWVAASRADWINNNFITDDTEAADSAAQEATMEYLSRTIKAASRFDGMKLPEDLARQLTLLKLASSPLPAPSDPKERAELADIAVWMTSTYGKGKYCPARLKGKCQSLGDLDNIIGQSRKWDELLEAWQGWHSIAPPIKAKFSRYVELGNKGAKEIGYSDLGAYWRAGYDMPPDAFEADTERLWQEVKPLYDQLHCYVRSKLRTKYGKDKIADKAPIPAHLLGNMWAQEWGNIYDLTEPYKGHGSLDVTRHIKQKKLDEKAMVKIGESFFTSLGMDKLPNTFWERSLFKKPQDRDVVCHASAWDVTYSDDLRIKMCIEPKEEDLITIHHELGHDYYYHSYFRLPILFQQGANDGFHEGIGDTLALSVTPTYLKGLGLLDEVPNDEKGELNVLFKMALDKVAFLPFGKIIDQWRWDVFNGKVKPDHYNQAWWALRLKYQGIAPPVARTEADFDPGAKYHVPANVPYVRYFLARLYQFQFYRALCKASGYSGPLHKCSFYGSKAAGDKLKAMLAMGASKPWPEAMKAISGESKADAGAMLEYFAPLAAWLKEQNKGETCGW